MFVFSIVAMIAAAQPPTAGVEPARVSAVDAAAVLAGKSVIIVLVKDFMKVDNTGDSIKSVEFPRYVPKVDDDQIVLGRWIEAKMAGGMLLPSCSTGAKADPAGNLIQTIRIGPFPGHQTVSITTTTLVARRERAAPKGEFPVLAADGYPEEVRGYLASTAMVVADHPVVSEAAKKILAKTHDTLQIAAAIVELANARSYLPEGDSEEGLPTSAFVLKHGGSCCSSAVAATAVFRACGVPAQVTYCPPPSYIHGVVQFYLNGYGWVRMDATSGSAKTPLVQHAQDLTLVRVFDTPIQMEKLEYAYAWPYQHNDLVGEYRFMSGGAAAAQMRMHIDASGALPFVQKPFPHLEPGSWSALLGSEAIAGAWADWAGLSAASRAGLIEGKCGALVDLLPAKRYLDVAGSWAMSPENQRPGPPGP